MEPIAVSLGLDEAVMTILARVEEIMKKDAVTLSKIKSQNQHLQQKLSRMTDQLESKVNKYSKCYTAAPVCTPHTFCGCSSSSPSCLPHHLNSKHYPP